MNKSITKIITNFSFRGFFVIISKIFSLITVPIIAQALGPEKYGSYNYVLALATYVTLPANWGFLAKGIREIAATNNFNDQSKIISEILSTRLTLATIFSLLFFAASFFLFQEMQTVLLILLALIHHIILVTFTDYYYYGTKAVKVPTLAHFISQILFLILVVSLISKPQDIYKLFIFMIIMVTIEAIILFIWLKNANIRINFSIVYSIKEFLKNFNLGMGLKTSIIQNSYPLIIIPFFFSDEILGNYSAIYKFYAIISLAMQTLILVVAPYIVHSKKMSKEKQTRYVKLFLGYSLIIGVISSLFLFFGSKIIVNILFGEKYTLSIIYLKWFSIFVISITPFFLALSSIMNNYSLDKQFMIGGLIQSILIIVFIPIILTFTNVIGMIIFLGTSLLLLSLYYTFHIHNFTKHNGK